MKVSSLVYIATLRDSFWVLTPNNYFSNHSMRGVKRYSKKLIAVFARTLAI